MFKGFGAEKCKNSENTYSLTDSCKVFTMKTESCFSEAVFILALMLVMSTCLT